MRDSIWTEGFHPDHRPAPGRLTGAAAGPWNMSEPTAAGVDEGSHALSRCGKGDSSEQRLPGRHGRHGMGMRLPATVPMTMKARTAIQNPVRRSLVTRIVLPLSSRAKAR